MRIPSTKAFRCTEDWLDTLCKRRLCAPKAGKRRGCTEGRFYSEPLARLLERAARLMADGGMLSEGWHRKVVSFGTDWRKAMEREKKEGR